MKKITWLSILIASICFAGGTGRTFQETQALTRAIPTDTTVGLRSDNLMGWRVSVCAASGQTLSGAGTIDVYNYNYTSGLWEFNKGLQMTITVGATSCSGAPCRCQVFPDFTALARLGSLILPAANGVTVSGGTTVVVYIQAWQVPQ